MSVIRYTKVALRATTLGAFLIGFTAVAGAQKSKPTQGGPPITTQGTIKSNPKADKGQATAESKRVDARDDKATKDADKVADKAENRALSAARSEPKALLKGIKFSKAERTTVKAIEKTYDGQLKDLEKQAKTLEKAGTPDAALVAKIDALRMQERAELRAALTPAQRVQFDANVGTLGTKKA